MKNIPIRIEHIHSVHAKTQTPVFTVAEENTVTGVNVIRRTTTGAHDLKPDHCTSSFK